MIRYLSRVKKPEPGGAVAETGSNPSPMPKGQNQDDPGDELGHCRGREPDGADQPVKRAPHVERGHDAGQDAQRHDEDERQRRPA